MPEPEAANGVARRRVALHAALGFHHAILEPVERALRGQVETLLTDDRTAVVRFAPHLVVLASSLDLGFLRHRLPDTVIGSIGHGLAAKRTPARLAEARDPLARTLDFLAVNDHTKIERYRASGNVPHEFWVTGYPQLDPLFRGDPPPPLPLDPGQRTVIFAPTWNAGLSAAGFLGERVVDWIRGPDTRLNVIIKPHPAIAYRGRRWLAWWERLAARDERVLFVDDPDEDIGPYLLAADVLVSDASSVIFQFLALDRPIVLVTNPRHRFDREYDPADICWRWRDVGLEVRDPRLLAQAVASALADPTIGAPARARYSAELFGGFRDGRNAERIAERILGRVARSSAQPRVIASPSISPSLRWRGRLVSAVRRRLDPHRHVWDDMLLTGRVVLRRAR